MKKYYIHNGTEQQGPFSLEELKDLKINQDTMIWFEGAENWQKANEVNELREFFKSIPPPIQNLNSSAPPPFIANKPKEKENNIQENTSKKSSNYYILGGITLFLIIGIWSYNSISQQAERQNQLESELAEKNAKIQVQQEAERKAKLEALKLELDQAVTNLRSANIQLNKIQEFQLLRTDSEKEAQVKAQLESIRSWENEVERLKTVIGKY